MAHDVFLSYSSKDKAPADATCAVLERNGIRVWMAPRDIMPGMGWAPSIIAAINGARVMVLIFSANANASLQIEREVERAIHKGIPVVPVRVEDVMPSESLEYFISTPHWLDAFTPPMEQHLERLADAVKRLLESGLLRRETEAPVEPKPSAPRVNEILPEPIKPQVAAEPIVEPEASAETAPKPDAGEAPG
jgi:hypothetical protein